MQWIRFDSSEGSLTSFTVPTAAGRATLQSLASACPNAATLLNLLGDTVAPNRTTTLNIAVPASVFGTTGSCNGTNRAGMGVEVGSVARTAPTTQLNDNHVVRIDHQLSPTQFISGRWLFNRTTQPNANLGVATLNDSDFTDKSMSALFSHTWVFSPRLTNEFRFNYGRINPQFPLSSSDPAALLPRVDITGLSIVGTSSSFPQGRVANNWQYQDTVSLVTGKHTFRFGADILRQLARQSAPVNARGTLAYRSATIPASGGNPAITTPALANFLDDFSGGTGSVTRQFGSPVYYPNLFRQAYFFQDQWKMHSSLTLNLGLRYENFGQPANFFPFPAATFDAASFVQENEIPHDSNNFGPSVGFAWSPQSQDGLLGAIFGGKTVVRGGFQTTFDNWFNNLLSNMAAANPNNVSNLTQTPPPATATNPRGIANVSSLFPALVPAPLNPRTTASSQFTAGIRNPYTNRFSLGMQRELPWRMIADVSYVGSLSRKLFLGRELNPTVPLPDLSGASPLTATSTGRLNPAIGSRTVRDSAGSSSYHALQVDLHRGMSPSLIGDLSYGLSYTWSKTMDYGQSEVFATNSANSSTVGSARLLVLSDARLDYGPSDLHRTHRAVATFVWDIRGPRGQGFLGQTLGGWSLAGVLPIQSGQPFSVFNGIDRDFDGSALQDRPDVGNWNAPVTSRAIVDATCTTGLLNPDTDACVTRNDVRWVQVAGYSLPGANTARRNAIESSSSIFVNLNIIKKFSITERTKLEYRAEIFNILNHENRSYSPDGPAFDQFIVNAGPDQFLRYNENGFSAQQASRTMRMGLKLVF